MSSTAFSLTDIYKTYGRGKENSVSILRGINLSIGRGEIVGLVAPSGAGKSTLLHISGLLDVPDSGTIEIGGRIMTGASDRLRTRTRRTEIGFVYQFHHLLPEFSARENVMLPQLANGMTAKNAAIRADDLLERVGLINRKGHRPAELSGGEQQRVALCRSLANSPKFVLADEPTGNLDPGTAIQVFDSLLELVRSTGLSALIATHNLELAAMMDRTVRLEDGKINEITSEEESDEIPTEEDFEVVSTEEIVDQILPEAELEEIKPYQDTQEPSSETEALEWETIPTETES